MTPAWFTAIPPRVLEINLAAGAGILLVLALRRPILNAFGARAAYGLWLLPLLATLAVLLPARLGPPARIPVAPAAPLQGQVDMLSGVAPASGLGPDLIQLGQGIAVWVWLAGAVAGLLWLSLSHLRFLAAERAGRAGPAVAGLLRPRIVLPADFEARFEPAERAAILAHERAHLRGQDSRINLLASVLACLGWFNPLVHLALRRLRLDQDLACDEAALARHPGQARVYAATLLKAQLHGQASPLACAFGAHPLAERIALAARGQMGPARRLAGLVLVAGLGLGVGAAAWAAQPARPAPAATVAPTDRALLGGAPAPRDGAPLPAPVRKPAARQLLAEAVPSTPEGETMITPSPAPRRLAAAAVLAFGLGTGSVQAAPQPAATIDYVAAPASAKTAALPKLETQPAPVVKYALGPATSKAASQPVLAVKPAAPAPSVRYASTAPAKTPPPPPPPIPPRIIPREVPPPPAPPPAPPPPSISMEYPSGIANLVLVDGRRINCAAGDECAKALAAMRAERDAETQAAKAQADAARREAVQAQAQVQEAKRQVLEAQAEARAAQALAAQARADAVRRNQAQ